MKGPATWTAAATVLHVALAVATGLPGPVAAPVCAAWALLAAIAARRNASHMGIACADDPARHGALLYRDLLIVPTLCFAGLYHAMRSADPDAFAAWPETADGDELAESLLYALLFSASTTLCVGFAYPDPARWTARLAVSAHLLVASASYAAFYARSLERPCRAARGEPCACGRGRAAAPAPRRRAPVFA